MTKIETLDGFDIPLRELTTEEANKEITWERIREYHYLVGEDFIDTHTCIVDGRVFCGWLLHKYPQHSQEILKISNKGMNICRSVCIQDFQHDLDFLGYDDETDIDKIYYDLAEFANQTIATKKRINQILIQIKEVYDE